MHPTVMQKTLAMVANFLKRLAVFESNVASDYMLNGLGHNQFLHSYKTLSVIKSKISLVCQVIHFPGRLSSSNRHCFRALASLRNAARYITALPKKETALPEWPAIIDAQMLVVEDAGPTMFALIAVMRALNRGYVREFSHQGRIPAGGAGG
jgi:hypothetical protein